MDFQNATKSYESWLASHLTIVPDDLKLKHERMLGDEFSFLRATYYRWAQTWQGFCPGLADAPGVLAVGDLHIENFGTWRDAEGRLVWGVNDFDEAFTMPYTNDLVRLATSAALALAAEELKISLKDACEAILSGYQDALRAGGQPFVLAESHAWLRALALNELRDPVRYWQKMDGLPVVRRPLPDSAREALEHWLPQAGLSYKIVHRVAGLGSLGRQRFVALADWRGGRVAREAKALVPSAAHWAGPDAASPTELFYETAITQAVRVPDPFVDVSGEWIVRRLAPDCSRIELSTLEAEHDEERLLRAMGWETANIHLGTPNAARVIQHDLSQRDPGWLRSAAETMVHAVHSDWKSQRPD
jgi:hypothetical protein